MTQSTQQRYKQPKAVSFCAYPKLVFAWPIIVMGLLFYFIAGSEPSEGLAATLGWIYLIGSVVVILTLGVDVERNYAAFWLVMFVALFFVGRWLQDVQGFTLLGDIYSWFVGLELKYGRGFGLATSCLLAVPYLVMLLWARIQHRWRVTHNEFEHFSWGRADDSLARGAKRVRSTYPDLLEFLLLGAGTLIVYSATGRSELRRINHVPFLPLLRRRISKILSSRKVTVATDQQQQAIYDEEMDDEEDQGRSSSSSSEAPHEPGGERL